MVTRVRFDRQIRHAPTKNASYPSRRSGSPATIEFPYPTGFLAYFTLSYLVILAGFVSFGIATFRAHVYPRWAGIVMAIGSVAAVAMAHWRPYPRDPSALTGSAW